MRFFNRSAAALLILLTCGPAQATVKILATTADWGALATELGGDRVSVYIATNALQDVHRVDAKPSLVARARTADLVLPQGQNSKSGGCRFSCRSRVTLASSLGLRVTSRQRLS